MAVTPLIPALSVLPYEDRTREEGKEWRDLVYPVLP
jgi:hypothetical protein